MPGYKGKLGLFTKKILRKLDKKQTLKIDKIVEDYKNLKGNAQNITPDSN